MADSMTKFKGDSQPGSSCRPSDKIYRSPGSESFIKKEMLPLSSCSHTSRDSEEHGELARINRDKEEEKEDSPGRSLSPEFLLKATVNGGVSENCEATEAAGQVPRKEDSNSTNAMNGVTSPVTCIYCNKMFPNKSSLDAHERSLHGGKKVYDCSVCDKQFNHRSSRNIHLRVHTGQRPYECDICKKRFRVSSHLRDHVRTHTGERPFKCVLCGRGFKQSSDMKKHRKTHFKTSLPNGKTKVVQFKKEEGSKPLPATFMVVRPDDVPVIHVDYQKNSSQSPSEQTNQKFVEKIKLVKVERTRINQSEPSPLSRDSGIKVESVNSPSPKNITSEKKYGYQEHIKQNSLTTEVITTGRIPTTNDAFGNPLLGNGFNFKEQEPMSGFVQPASDNRGNYRPRNASNNTPKDNIPEKHTDEGGHHNAQVSENQMQNSVSMETQENEFTMKPDVKKDTYRGERPTVVHDTATPTIYNLASRSIFTEQRTDRKRIHQQGESPREIEMQNETAMDVQTTVGSNVINVADSSEHVDDGLTVAGETRKPDGVRKAVVVKLRNDKGNATFRRNTIISTRKQAKPVKRARESSIQCASCQERFRSPEIFTAHRCGKNEKSYKCSVCGKMFARSTLLRQHMVLHQGSKRFKFKCSYCGRAFRHRSHLRDHERIHTGERPFKCSFCPKAFKQSSDLRKHENLHTGATRYCCEKCGVDFKRCDALKKHAMLHKEGEVTVLKCEKCQSLFATADGRSSHVCQNKNRYRCQLCVQRFSNAAALRQHCHQEHGEQSNETCLKCEFCKLQLQSLDELEVHLGTHQLLKTHKCNVCDQRFSLIGQLEEHAKTHDQNMDVVERISGGEIPAKPFRIPDYSTSNHGRNFYEENESSNKQSIHFQENEHVLEINTARSVPVVSSSSEPVRQTYDFIPSSYQSLVRSVPMYGYVQNGRWCPPTNIKEPGSYSAPRHVEPHVTAKQDGEDMGSRNDLPEEPHCINTTTEDKQMTPNVNQAKDSPVNKVDNHFLKSLRHQVAKRRYTCLNCMKVFYTETTLVDHVCDIQSERFFECLVCEKEFSNEEDLQGHMRNHWKQVTYFKCNLCGERVRYEELLKKHNLKHLENDRTTDCTSEDSGPGDETTAIPWSTTRVEQPNAFTSGAGNDNLDVVGSTKPMSISSTSITSLNTPVITSVSSSNGFLSKTANHEKPTSKPSERGFTEHHSLEIKNEVASPLASPHLPNETTGNRERSLVAVHPVDKESMSRSSHAPHVTYFDTRKPMTGAYLNVFGQGSAVVVPAMHALDASGHYAGSNGLVYPIAMAYQRRITEYK